MNVLIEQINPLIGAIEENTETIIHGIKKAQDLNCQIVVFPELAICGYPPKDLLHLDDFLKKIEDNLQKISKYCKNIMAIVGTPRRSRGKIFNSAAIFQNENLIDFEDKSLLPNYDVFNERRYFNSKKQGKKVFNFQNKKIAVCICEDLWLPSNDPKSPLKNLKKEKLDLLINLSSSPFSHQKFTKRLSVAKKAAIDLKTELILCNQVGGNDSLIFDGKSFHLDKNGNLMSKAKGFSSDSLQICLNQSKQKTTKIHEEDEKELFEALVCGLRDYFQKCGFKSACLGLSGGIDSALVACLAAEALGSKNVHAIAMPSRYSSPESLEDAQALAKAIQIELHTISIDPLFQGFLDTLAPFFTGLKPDLCEENLQARIRGMLLMAFSNKFKHILLSTGNKSEVAMGYTTLYGDQCGGLSVINDLLKEEVYSLSRWINKRKKSIPIRILEKAPTAELRPNQKDSDSLPPYKDLDKVLKAYIVEKQSVKKIAKRFSFEENFVSDLIDTVHRNEYKRRQSAPGLKISEKAFSDGWVFPIAQGWLKPKK